MKKELVRTIICMAIGFMMLFLLFGCQNDTEFTIKNSARCLGDGEAAAAWRQPGIFGSLGK